MNLENADVLFAALFIIKAIDSVDLLGSSNYFLSKHFVVFNYLKVKPIFYYMYINQSLMPFVDITNNESTKVISCSEQP